MDIVRTLSNITESPKSKNASEILVKQQDTSSNDLFGYEYRVRFDYNVLMEQYRVDFNERWKNLKPSPHVNLVPFEDFPLIGAGKYGTVRLMQNRKDDTYCAVKILRKEMIVKRNVVEQTITEKQILSCVQFPFLISLQFSFKDNDCLFLGLPFAGGGDLFTYLRKRNRFAEPVVRFYAAQILMALEYLHNVNCLYRDLKPENLLIDANGYLKLTDFGLSKLVDNRTTTLCGTPEYLAPEMLQLKPYGPSVDWWTFGIIIYELASGHTPFYKYSHNLMLMYSKICEGGYETPISFSNEMKNIVERLLDIHMATRLGNTCNGCFEIKRHKFFRTIDWQALLRQEIMPPFRPFLKHEADTSHFRKINVSKSRIIFKKSDKDLYSALFEGF